MLAVLNPECHIYAMQGDIAVISRVFLMNHPVCMSTQEKYNNESIQSGHKRKQKGLLPGLQLGH